VVNTSNDNTLSTASQGNATFQWIFCSTGLAIANETDSVFVPTVNGVYAVSLTNGCGTVTSNCVTIDNMALDEEETYLVIHPNPTWNIVYLKGLEATDKPYELHDLMGRVVAVGNISAAQNAIDMTSFASGTYRLVVKEVGVISIIKQ
jgi:hypothetical protein